MDMQHDSIGLGRAFMKNPDQGFHDKLHSRVVIVVHQHPEHRGPLNI